jgi:hypothetical protein
MAPCAQFGTWQAALDAAGLGEVPVRRAAVTLAAGHHQVDALDTAVEFSMTRTAAASRVERRRPS